MKAAQIHSYGDPSVITIADIETPTPKAGQVLVEVHAASLNPFDTKLRAGDMQRSLPLNFPVTLGGDIAGIVTDVGEGDTHFQVGDSVYGQANVVAGNSGAFAEYAVTAVDQIAAKPENIDFLEAASLPLVGVSAWQALMKHIVLKSGQKILIHGGAGGIGSVAIQIAKSVGAYVATTATGDNIDFVRELGADEVIDYKTTHFTEKLKEYDAVFDTVGGDDFSKSLSILSPGGVAVSMIAEASQAIAHELEVTAITQGTVVTTEALDELRKLIESGIVTPHVTEVYALSQIQEAFRARESGTVRSKIVLRVR